MFIKNKDYDFTKILNSLNGTIRLITGNHDDINSYPSSILERGLVKKYGFWLSHAPIHPDELRGFKNIYGHTHKNIIPDNRYINVCCENVGYTPISLEEIKAR